MAKQVIWSKLAQQDRKSILDYWINQTKSYAYSKRLNQIFENSADLISSIQRLVRGQKYKMLG